MISLRRLGCAFIHSAPGIFTFRLFLEHTGHTFVFHRLFLSLWVFLSFTVIVCFLIYLLHRLLAISLTPFKPLLITYVWLWLSYSVVYTTTIARILHTFLPFSLSLVFITLYRIYLLLLFIASLTLENVNKIYIIHINSRKCKHWQAVQVNQYFFNE